MNPEEEIEQRESPAQQETAARHDPATARRVKFDGARLIFLKDKLPKVGSSVTLDGNVIVFGRASQSFKSVAATVTIQKTAFAQAKVLTQVVNANPEWGFKAVQERNVVLVSKMINPDAIKEGHPIPEVTSCKSGGENAQVA